MAVGEHPTAVLRRPASSRAALLRRLERVADVVGDPEDDPGLGAPAGEAEGAGGVEVEAGGVDLEAEPSLGAVLGPDGRSPGAVPPVDLSDEPDAVVDRRAEGEAVEHHVVLRVFLLGRL